MVNINVNVVLMANDTFVFVVNITPSYEGFISTTANMFTIYMEVRCMHEQASVRLCASDQPRLDA